MLAELLEPLRSKYDYILIDICPSVGILTINALAAAVGNDAIDLLSEEIGAPVGNVPTIIPFHSHLFRLYEGEDLMIWCKVSENMEF